MNPLTVFPLEITELILIPEGKISRAVMCINRDFNSKWNKLVTKIHSTPTIFPIQFDKYSMSNFIYWQRYLIGDRHLDVYQVIVVYGSRDGLVPHTLINLYCCENNNWSEYSFTMGYYIDVNPDKVTSWIPGTYGNNIRLIDEKLRIQSIYNHTAPIDIKAFAESNCVVDGYIFDRKAYELTWKEFQTECSYETYLDILKLPGGVLNVVGHISGGSDSNDSNDSNGGSQSLIMDLLKYNLSW